LHSPSFGDVQQKLCHHYYHLLHLIVAEAGNY